MVPLGQTKAADAPPLDGTLVKPPGFGLAGGVAGFIVWPPAPSAGGVGGGVAALPSVGGALPGAMPVTLPLPSMPVGAEPLPVAGALPLPAPTLGPELLTELGDAAGAEGRPEALLAPAPGNGARLLAVLSEPESGAPLHPRSQAM